MIAHQPAEDDVVVLRQPEIVELRARVVHALAILPADPRELLVGERLGREHVVAHLHHAAVDVGNPDLRGAAAEHDARRAHAALRRRHEHRAAFVGHGHERRVLVEPHTERQRRALQPPREFRRMHDAAAVARPQCAREQRRIQLFERFLAVQQHDVVAVFAMQVVVALQVRDVLGIDRHRHLAVPLDIGVDVVALQRVLETVEVVMAECLELRDVVREHAHRVRQPVHHRRRDDPARAARCAVRHLAGLDQHHVQVRHLLLRLHGRPQPREAAADDQQVGRRVADEFRLGGRRGRVVEPVREQLRIRERRLDAQCDRCATHRVRLLRCSLLS